MRFGVLGPLRIWAGDAEVGITAARDRTVLAMLLLQVGAPVTLGQLTAAVWSGAPPRSARNQIQTCVYSLRRRLAKAGGDSALIGTDPAGYRLLAAPQQVDAHQFRHLLGQARAAVEADRAVEARERYRQAAALWRGPALADLDSTEIRRVAAGLDEEHARALEEQVEVELRLGSAGELLSQLTELVGRHPYREQLHSALMRTLYRAGRPAEALAVFRRLRHRLREELGTDPGAELQRLHRGILKGDLVLAPLADETAVAASPSASRLPGQVAPSVPRELPREASCFTGRAAELARIRARLIFDGQRGRPPVLVLYGPGGVGKSALAVRAGHELAEHFPDGQLYVDLRGATPGLSPVPPAAVAGAFLRRLGVPPAQIPAAPADAAALLRSVTAGRRLLMLLDNAADAGQVAPLLPGTSTGAVLVTSRRPLPSLDADDRVRVGVLADDAAMALLTGLSARAAAEPATARELLAVCGGLPLAVRVAAGRLAARPDLSVAEYARRLADRSRRLDELQIDDLAVRACLRTGYDALLAEDGRVGRLAARAFRALGLLQVPDVEPRVVAAMLQEPDLPAVGAALDRLADTQLLEPAPDGRYRLHDLVRLVAAELAVAQEAPAARQRMVSRAVAYFAATLHRSEVVLRPARQLWFAQPEVPPDLPLPVFGGPEEASAWVDQNLSSLLEAMSQAVSGDRADPCSLWFADPLWLTLDNRCHWFAADRLTRDLEIAVRAGGDPELIACAALLRGRSAASLGDYESAEVRLEHALGLLRRLGNQHGVVIALNGLGIVAARRRDHETSLAYYHHALDLARSCEMDNAEGLILSNLSVNFLIVGQLDRAAAAAELATVIFARQGDSLLASATLNLGAVHLLRGEYDQARRHMDRALQLAGRIGDRTRQCECLLLRSGINLDTGRVAEARADAEQVLRLADDWGYRHVAAAGRWQLSRTLRVCGAAAEAAREAASAAQAYRELHDTFRDPLIDVVVQHAPTPDDRSAQIRIG